MEGGTWRRRVEAEYRWAVASGVRASEAVGDEASERREDVGMQACCEWEMSRFVDDREMRGSTVHGRH